MSRRHVSVRMDPERLARVDALMPSLSTKYTKVTRSTVLRALIGDALPRFQAKAAQKPGEADLEPGGADLEPGNQTGRHVSVRLENEWIGRVDALIPSLSTEYTEVTRSDVLRALIDDALPRFQPEAYQKPGEAAPKPGEGAGLAPKPPMPDDDEDEPADPGMDLDDDEPASGPPDGL